MPLLKKIEIPYVLNGITINVNIEFVKPIKLSKLPKINIIVEDKIINIYNFKEIKNRTLSLKGVCPDNAPRFPDGNKKV